MVGIIHVQLMELLSLTSRNSIHICLLFPPLLPPIFADILLG